MDGLGSRRRIAHESCQMLVAFNSYEFVKLDSMPLCTKVTFSSSTSLFMESSVPCNPVFEGSTPLSQMFVLILTKVFLGLLPHDECCSLQPGVGYIMVANIQLFTSYQQLSHSHSK